MKVAVSIAILIGFGILFCTVLSVPFFICVSFLSDVVPALSWVQCCSVLIATWCIFMVIYFAKSIGETITDGMREGRELAEEED
jgi:hypothetical protein